MTASISSGHDAAIESGVIATRSCEHDTAGALLSRLRELTDDYRVPSDGCTSYRVLFARLAELEADTHFHIYKENSVLFPAVLQLDLERAS